MASALPANWSSSDVDAARKFIDVLRNITDQSESSISAADAALHKTMNVEKNLETIIEYQGTEQIEIMYNIEMLENDLSDLENAISALNVAIIANKKVKDDLVKILSDITSAAKKASNEGNLSEVHILETRMNQIYAEMSFIYEEIVELYATLHKNNILASAVRKSLDQNRDIIANIEHHNSTQDVVMIDVFE